MFCRLFAQCLRMGDNQRFLFRRPCGFILVIAIAPTGIGVFQSDAIFLGALGERFLMFLHGEIMADIQFVIIFLQLPVIPVERAPCLEQSIGLLFNTF